MTTAEEAMQDTVDAFVLACGGTNVGTHDEGKFAEVALYLKNGGDVNAKHRVGWPALSLATMHGQVKTAKLLLDKGAALDATRATGATALHDAILCSAEIFALLLDKGADVMVRDQHGFTPLHAAVMLGQRAMAMRLLEHGAEVKARTNGGATPLHLAGQEGHVALVTLLLAHGASL